MSTLIIYHQVKQGINCPDGIAAAWVASKALSKADLLGCVYGEEPPDISKYTHIVIVDFSFSKAVLEGWSKRRSITVIDHHKTAWENFQDLSNQIYRKFDMNECGATLTWQFFFPNQPMPVFLEYIRDRDLWNHELEFTEEVHEASASIGRTFEFFNLIAAMDKNALLDYLVPIGTEKLKPKREAIALAVSRLEFGVVAGFDNIPFVRVRTNEERLISDICSAMYKKLPDPYFVACVTEYGKWSLRSNKHGNDTDVGVIAKRFGGGGHKNAAGFEKSNHLE